MGSVERNFVAVALIVLGCGSAFGARSQDRRARVVYGNDERVDAAQYPNEKVKTLSRAVAAMIPKEALTSSEGFTEFPKETLEQSAGVCASERFSSQITAAECTGFLVAPDLLVTAGHCATSEEECEQNAWVFDYVVGADKVPTANVFSCERIVAQEKNETNDYAVIQLDHPVFDRAPLTIRTVGEVNASDKLIVIGHPSGLPLKIDDNGLMRNVSTDKNYFVAELDTFGGNSGSPVINQTTLQVEGILVRGERDYTLDPELGCSKVNVCATGTCRGEDVQKITKVPGIRQVTFAAN